MAQPDALESIRKVFSEWDTDKTGIISRDNLRFVLKKIGGGSNFNVDLLMTEIDTNGDGEVQYSEFIDWVMNPSAKTKMNQAGRHLSSFDFTECLEPLFGVYSAGKGVITKDDFRDCHTLIQGSLKLHPKECGSADVALGVDDVNKIFKNIKKTVHDELTLEEFMAWQTETMERSGIPNYDLKDVIFKLVEVMQKILHIDQQTQEGRGEEHHEKQLMKAIESLAAHTRSVWEQRPDDVAGDEYEVEGHKYNNHWEDPPIGMSLERLKKYHMSHDPVRTYRLKTCEAEVHMCVPQVPSEVDPERGRLWYTKIIRTTVFDDSSVTVSEFDGHGHDPVVEGGPDKARYRRSACKPRVMTQDPYYYMFEPKKLAWTPMPDPIGFYHAVETLAPELQLFALLKSEANMGMDIRWKGIQMALQDGVEMQLIKDEHVHKYNDHMMEFAHEMLVEGGHVDMQDMDVDTKQHALDFLGKFPQMPRGVMAMLSELGFVKTSPVWKEFMEG